MKKPMKDALFCDCETDLERSEFFASGRAYETGIVAASVERVIAKAFFDVSLNSCNTDNYKRTEQCRT